MKSRYDLMKESSQSNGRGENYPEVLSLDISNKTFSSSLTKVRCSQMIKDRFYYLTYKYYGICELDDLLMWINGISDYRSLEVGETIYVPSVSDMISYYTERKVR